MRLPLSALTAAGLLLTLAPPAQAQTGSSTPTAILVSGPDVGRRAPDFTLPWASKNGAGPAEAPYQLWGDLGKPVVLVFFSRAFTKTCTAHLQTLTQRYDELFGPDVVVVGISTDPVETQSRFAASLGLPFRLLSDPDQRVGKKYGSYDSSGFLRRTVYVIGPDGKVQYRNLRFDPNNQKHYAALGAAVRKMGM